MKIIEKAQVGSLESSDVMILIEPNKNKGRRIEIDSSVEVQFGKQIKNLINCKLDELQVVDVHLIAKDKGALELTINARVETAVKRAAGIHKEFII